MRLIDKLYKDLKLVQGRKKKSIRKTSFGNLIDQNEIETDFNQESLRNLEDLLKSRQQEITNIQNLINSKKEKQKNVEKEQDIYKQLQENEDLLTRELEENLRNLRNSANIKLNEMQARKTQFGLKLSNRTKLILGTAGALTLAAGATAGAVKLHKNVKQGFAEKDAIKREKLKQEQYVPQTKKSTLVNIGEGLDSAYYKFFGQG